MNGTFGLVLGLIGLIYIAAVMGMLGIEINVVLARRLWPRALLTPFTDAVELTEADRGLRRLRPAQRHKGFERVDVTFDEDDPGAPAREPTGAQRDAAQLPQGHEAVAPVPADRVAPSPSRTTSSISPATGTTSRPGAASWSSSAAGSSRASADTRTRSYGASAGTPEHPGRGGVDPRPRLAGAGEVHRAARGQLGLELDAHDHPRGAGQVGEQRGRPAGPGTDVEHPVAGAHRQQAQHRRHRPRLAAGLAVADVEGPVERRVPPLVAGQEAGAGHRLERGTDGVHPPSQPRRGGRGKNIEVRAAYSG